MNANSMILLAVLAMSCPAQDPAAAARKFAERDFAGARAEYDKAAAAEPATPEWQYDRALAAFRAGDLDAAVDAIERYAAMPGGGRVDLHHGLLGNVRFLEAKALQQSAVGSGAANPPAPDAKPADPVASLEAAVQKAKTARDAFVRGAAAPEASPALARNAERAVRLLRELEQQLEEAKKQREQQQKQDDSKKDEQKSDDQKKDDQKQDNQQKDDQKSEDQQKDDQQKNDQKSGDQEPEPKDGQKGEPKPAPTDAKDEAKPEPQSGDGKPTEPKEGEQKPEPQPAQNEPAKESGETPRGDAPGEQQGSASLSPEQRARLLELLEKQDQQLKKIRAAAVRGRRPVERDW